MKPRAARAVHDLGIVCVAALLAAASPRAPGAAEPPRRRIEERVMGFDVHLQLFDRNAYENRVLPAYKAFEERRDVGLLVALVREARLRVATPAQGGAGSGRSLLTEADFAEDLDVLEGRSVYAPGRHPSGAAPTATTPDDLAAFVREHVAPELVEVLCLVADLGADPEANLGRTVVVPYLYRHSEWVREALTFERTITGGALEIPIGESSEWVTTDNVRKFLAELAAIPRPVPAGDLQTQFDHLRDLLRRALENPRFAIVLTVG